MARTPRVQALSRSFTATFDEAAEDAGDQLGALARAEHGKIMAEEPRPSGFRRWVDGREGAPEDTVRPDGVIRYLYQRLDQVVDFALDTLRELSPVRSGNYRDSHTVFINDVEAFRLAAGKFGENVIERPGFSEIVIANGVPYARKIEHGSMRMTVPGSDHVYQQAEAIVKRRMGNLARIEFSWRTVLPAGVRPGTRTSGGLAGNRTRTVEDAFRFPALIIRER